MMLLFRKIFFLLMLSVFAVSVKAQQTHFIYLQTDNGEPFYVKMNNKVISSSAEGYVILPGMLDGSYPLVVGFPKKEHPEETFTVNVEDNNQGFLIKNFEDNGLQLFNLETLALLNGTRDSSRMVTATVTKDADPFSKMLANVVKDSSILQNHQVEVPKPVTAAVDTSAVRRDIVSAPVSTADTFSTAKTDVPVSKLSSSRDSTGLQMVYATTNNQKTDTVSVFMPAENEANKENSVVAENKNADNSSFTDSVKFSITPTDVKQKKDAGFVLRKDSIVSNTDSSSNPVQVFVIGPSKDHASVEKEKTRDENADMQAPGKNRQKKDAKNGENELILLPKVVTSSKVNSDCKAFAGNEDFLRLRKKMAAENSSENMIKVAKKYFRNKCFSTEQIKDLSYLFLNDEGRYNFFDAAYPHTSDSDQYDLLEGQLTDPYYVNRFKAMIRK